MRSLVVLIAVIYAVVAAPQERVKRSVGHVAYAAVPAAVSHQSRVDVRSSPAVVSQVLAEPVIEARALPVASPVVYSVPVENVYVGGGAVSHQSRVDVRTSPAVVASAPVAYAAPAVYAAAPAVYAAPAATVYAGGSAVSHQSRVDVQSSPAIVSEQVVAPAVVEARAVWAPSVYSSAW